MRVIVALAVLVALVAIVGANEDGSTTTSTTTAANTFFGVDRNDEEAVLAKHKELADEQYRKMFGDEELPDFSIDLDKQPSKFTQKIREMAQKFGDLFHKKPASTTTAAPETSN